jgi:hypothetical protein
MLSHHKSRSGSVLHKFKARFSLIEGERLGIGATAPTTVLIV